MGEQLSSVFERIKMCHLLFCDFELLRGLQLKAHGHPQNGAVGRTCGGIKSSAGPIRPKTEEVIPKQEPHGLEEERFYSREVGTKKPLPTWERSKESNHSRNISPRSWPGQGGQASLVFPLPYHGTLCPASLSKACTYCIPLLIFNQAAGPKFPLSVFQIVTFVYSGMQFILA